MTRSTPKKIYVEITTRCNLHCKKCVKFSPGAFIPEADMTLATYKNILPALGDASELILNGIGEPLLHPELLDFIRLARQEMSPNGIIGFQSNAHLLSKEISDALVTAGLNTLCLSVDTTSLKRDLSQQSLYGVSEAMEILQDIQSQHHPNFEIGLEIVLTRSTVERLPSLVRWAADNGVAYIISSHLIPYAQEHEQEALFQTISTEVLDLYEKYNLQAIAQGIDLNMSYREYERYVGTRTDKQVLHIFKALRDEAQSKDLQLNLKKVFAYHKTVASRLEEICNQAAEIAHRNGVRLQLPSHQSPRDENRNCKFMEDEAVFIDVTGSISPCRFLWHTYECRFNSESIEVRQRSFGNVQHTPLDAVWQAVDYSSFRSEAKQSEYATCGTCSMAPCQTLVNDMDYANDCFGSTVPCGHCHWNLGGFQCL